MGHRLPAVPKRSTVHNGRVYHGGAMSNATVTRTTGAAAPTGAAPRGEPCVLVLFGASGDLTRRLLMPALYNLACDRLLPEQFAVVGVALDPLSDEQFRDRM